jgi:hypothetical protein
VILDLLLPSKSSQERQRFHKLLSTSDLVYRSVGGVIIKIAYGEKIFEEHGKELVRLNAESLDIMTYAFEHLWLPNFFNFSMFQFKSIY